MSKNDEAGYYSDGRPKDIIRVLIPGHQPGEDGPNRLEKEGVTSLFRATSASLLHAPK